MTNKDENQNKLATTSPPGDTSLVQRRKIGGSALHQRVAAQPLPPVQSGPAQVTVKDNPFDVSLTVTNRIGMMLDCSSSMDERVNLRSKIEHLREACQSFLQSCDFSDTSIAIETFPSFGANGDEDDEESYGSRLDTNDPLAHLLPQMPKAPTRKRGLCNIQAFLSADIDRLKACGGTPMGQCMNRALGNHPITRGIIVSDGEADSSEAAREAARKYKAAEVPIDTVHIGLSYSGEALLKEIAEMTGGMYIKFDNVANFAKNFKYLAPAFRAMLTSGQEGAALLGAKEIK